MNRALPIVAVIVGALLVVGCFDVDEEDDHDRLELKQLIEYPSTTSGPQGLYEKDDGTIVAVGTGDLSLPDSGEIWEAPANSSDLSQKNLDTTSSTADYYGFSRVTYSATLDKMFVCSNPKVSGGTVGPSIVQFGPNGSGNYIWERVANFNNNPFPGQVCSGLMVLGDFLFATNASALNASYPAVYWGNLAGGLPGSLGVVLMYGALNLNRRQMLSRTIMDIKPLKAVQTNNNFSFLLLNRGSGSIDSVSCNYDPSTSLMSVNGPIINMSYDSTAISEPTAFLNIDDRTFLVASGLNSSNPGKIFELNYFSGPIQPRQQLIAEAFAPVTSFTYGPDREGIGQSVYAATPIKNKDDKKFYVLEYTLNHK